MHRIFRNVFILYTSLWMFPILGLCSAIKAGAARVAKNIVTKPEREGSLQFTEDLLDMHWRWNQDKYGAATLTSWGPEAAADFDRHRNEPVRLPVATPGWTGAPRNSSAKDNNSSSRRSSARPETSE